MATSSSPCKSPKNPIPISFSSMYCATRRGSKAQLCFLKILHMISIVRPPQITMAKSSIFSSETKESYVDSKTREENNGSEFDLSDDVYILPEMDESSEFGGTNVDIAGCDGVEIEKIKVDIAGGDGVEIEKRR
ncbi:Hypothetical predicted protein [Olea europaea subsp. europaea]|uniref:Uncharacterized protein n=1 Tax=Olea europaea subsp. europaea TaxID=158383 RepID=A0A8S0SQS6_OLEEU|nr:Hypothetical predicted protein [Olea europaea subsp. europaea]